MFIKRKSANLFKKSVILALGKLAKPAKKSEVEQEEVKEPAKVKKSQKQAGKEEAKETQQESLQ